MPSFLKDLSIRRRSRASFTTAATNASSSNSSCVGAEDAHPTISDPTLNSAAAAAADRKPSPPSTLASLKSRSSTYLPTKRNGERPPPVPSNKPRLISSQSARYSLAGMPSQNGETTPRPTPATSALAPRVVSVSDGSWVHQKVLLISGECADVNRPIDGTITVCHHQDNFPATHWPVCDSHFKALVHLQPGPNRLRLDFTSQQLSNPTGQLQPHSSWISINYLPLTSAPPIHLCMLLARDSPQTYDAVPERARKEGNGLDTAVRKFRTAAYLWQAFTAEQMNRNGFGRRCYRYDEEWQPGTLTWKDMETGQMRNEAKVHIIRVNETTAQIRDLEIAQQHGPATRKGALFEIASRAVKDYFGTKDGQKQYVSCMFLDTQWDPQAGVVRGHAALGGGDDSLRLAIFGSHCLQSYPAHIEEVVPAFTDCTRTDTNFVANDCGDAGSNWEAANIGIGAHLHETGHLLGCPHQESGVMLRDYVTLNRTFLTREPFSTRTKQQGLRLCLPKDECTWHRLDALRFRVHPCFQLPTDPAATPDSSIQVWAVDNGTVLVTAASGIGWIEIFTAGEDICHHWIEYIDQGNGPAGAPKQVTLTEQNLRDQIGDSKRKSKLDIKIFSCGGGEHEVKDFANLASKDSKIKLPDGRPGFRSSKLGFSQMNGSQPTETIFGTCQKMANRMQSVRVYHGNSLDGIEFFYENNTSELFGKKGGTPGGSEFVLDIRNAETVIGFYLRAGAWIDGIQILTSTGRRSEIFGNATGGSGHTLIPPRGYSVAGIYGSCGPWVDGFGLIITR